MPTFYFDFVDPVSYLVETELDAIETEGPVVERAPFEIRPPPTPMVTVDDPSVAARWAAARKLAGHAGPDLRPPALVPWSRKAHELHLFARTVDAGAAVRKAVFEAYMLQGRDIGRVDVLVEIARGAGLDPSETKAVLDVDRFEAAVSEARRSALALGASEPPVLVRGHDRLEGFHNRTTLGTFLRGS